MIDLQNQLATFPIPTLAEWHQAIEKELGNKQLKDIDYHINERIHVTAALRTNESTASVRYQTAARNQWLITELFHGNMENLNTRIIEALQYGTETLMLQYSPRLQLEQALKGVHSDFIQTILMGFPIRDFRKYVELLLKMRSEEKALCGAYLPKFDRIEDIENLYSDFQAFSGGILSDRFRLFYISPTLECPISDCDQLISSILKQLKTILSTLGRDASKNTLITLPIGDSILAETAKIRALKIVCENLYQAMFGADDVQSGIAYMATNDLSTYSAEPNTNRIRAALQAWAAIQGGIDYLTLIPGDLSPPLEQVQFNRRISRNIHHIYREESYLHRVQDPLQGSFHIETLSKKIAESAWSMFIESSDQSPGYPTVVDFSGAKYSNF
jgi:hypothetical protein